MEPTSTPSLDTLLPTLSVVIPAHNSQNHLPQTLDAIAAQQYPAWWELIVVSGGSTDQTVRIAQSYADRVPRLTVIARDEPATAPVARNLGIREAKGDGLVFLDSDDIPDPDYLLHLGRALARHPVVGGKLEITKINSHDQVGFRKPLQFDRIDEFCGYRPAVIGAAMGARREAVEQVGGFDETLRNQQDIDLSWRLLYAGMPAQFVPEAVVHYRYRDGATTLFRQHVAYGKGEVELFRKHHSSGMPRRNILQIGMAYLRLLAQLRHLGQADGRNRCAATFGLLVGRVVGSVRSRTVYL